MPILLWHLPLVIFWMVGRRVSLSEKRSVEAPFNARLAPETAVLAVRSAVWWSTRPRLEHGSPGDVRSMGRAFVVVLATLDPNRAISAFRYPRP
jgi:hypothetical protein